MRPPQPPVSIALAGALESQAIAQLHAALFEQPWNRAGVAGLMAHPGALAFVARSERNAASDPEGAWPLAGFVLGLRAADQAELLSIGVSLPERRSRVASALLEALCAAAAGDGATRVFLEVARSNTPALALYRSFGFAEVGRRQGYYDRRDAPATDALILSKSLQARAMRGLVLPRDL